MYFPTKRRAVQNPGILKNDRVESLLAEDKALESGLKYIHLEPDSHPLSFTGSLKS